MASMNYSINLDKNTLCCEFINSLDSNELIKFITTVRSDPSFHPDLNTIADFRKAEFSENYIEIAMLVEYFENTAAERGHFKLAVICGPETIKSASLFKILKSDNFVKICVNDKEANEWVSNN